MIVTTTPSVEGYRITGYYGIVFGEVITGINFLRDFGAGIRNIVGGRSEGYEQELLQTRNEALQELEQRAEADEAPGGRDGHEVAVARGGDGGHRPVHAREHAVELLGLHGMLDFVHEHAGRYGEQGEHHECRHDLRAAANRA